MIVNDRTGEVTQISDKLIQNG
ncbi:hypothetical protein [Rahnella victoriana]|nr:hypothetical protein [Rahnella victoriana]